MRQKAQLLLDEAATWSLLWFIYGKGNVSLGLDVQFLRINYVSFQDSYVMSGFHVCLLQFTYLHHTH